MIWAAKVSPSTMPTQSRGVGEGLGPPENAENPVDIGVTDKGRDRQIGAWMSTAALDEEA